MKSILIAAIAVFALDASGDSADIASLKCEKADLSFYAFLHGFNVGPHYLCA
jgi:hypothetical protein